ncbi:hypothetical protein H5407_19645 [Mitsuaria sp. WAJ17]|uniref:hypothetical protein n=1 Tax=Mitsuaria sp. WAJ17 TaxID=2761452 RepID=UPI00160302DB|nr:hypothetical protein [Mitsuaria sp. WAJ17]MBB2487454.1 hypothetical protein [Mitsuaria sp. WAJ17]
MFKSTYTHLALAAENRTVQALRPTAMDLERGTRLIRIGSRSGVDDDTLDLFCMMDAQRSIPFSAQIVTEVGWKPLREFRVSGWTPLPHHDLGIRIVDVRVDNIGAHPSTIWKGIRSRVNFEDLWAVESAPPLTVLTEAERRQVFLDIQEALPVWWFDNYVSVERPDPAVCRHVSAAQPEWSDVADLSGNRERASVLLMPPPLSNQPYQEVEAWLAAVEGKTLTIEEIMARVLDFERGTLFYDHLLTWGLSDNARFWQLLRDSHRAHYVDHYDGFERFLVRIHDLMTSRLAGRRVLQTYPSWRRPRVGDT